MMRFISLLLVSIFGTSAIGDTVPVNSGEHEDYTRLVLTIDPTKPWRLERLGEESRLILDGLHDIQLSNIFDRIPRTRLKDARTSVAEGSTIFLLDLNCPCEVNAYPYQGAYLILDISDPLKDNETEIALSSLPKMNANFSPDSLPNLDVSVDSNRPTSPHYVTSGPEASWPEQVDEEPAEDHSFYTETTEINPDLQKTVDKARDALIRQLSFAADQGLLDFKPNESNIEEVEPPHEEVAVVEGHRASPMEGLMNQEQVNIQSVYDLNRRDDTMAINIDKRCLPDFEFDIENWGSGEDFSKELSNLRAEQLGEFDISDIEKVEGLIRLYIRYGFDAEARYLIASYPDEIKHADVLGDLSYAMSGREFVHMSGLPKAVDCGGAVGLWALASEDASSVSDLMNQESALNVFENLPADIRRSIGPRLIEAYLRRDMLTEAQLVADLITRAFGEDGHAVEMSQAGLMIEKGQVPTAEGVYHEVIASNTTASVPALIELAELYLAEGRGVQNDYLDRIRLEADTQRGTHLGLELRSLEVRLLSQNVGEETALLKLKHEIEIDPENEADYREMGREILSRLSHINPDFLKITMSNLDFLRGSPDDFDLRTHLANEALLDGFPNAASELLKGVETSVLENTYLLGLIEVAAENLGEAERIFLKEDNDIARQQLLRLYIAGGKFGDALATIDAMKNPEMQSVDPDWFTGSWRQALNTDPAALTIYRLYINTAQETLAMSAIKSHDTVTDIKTDSLENVRNTLSNVVELQDEIDNLGLGKN